MQSRKLVAYALLAIALLSAACAAPPAAAPAAPPAPAGTGTTEIALTTNPNPPTSAADTELIVDVKDANGQPLSGATVTVLADMAAHSMGVMQGQATDQGNGRYATVVPLTMSGDWKITVEVRDSAQNLLRRQDFTLAVP